jgi:hypothetical protein
MRCTDPRLTGRFVVVTALSAALTSFGAFGNEGWTWHEANTELYAPTFSPDGREVALVRKRHLPDGHEAEAFTEKELKARYARIDKDERYSDPQVVIIKVGKQAAEPIDWGWSPVFSPDGGKIAYAHQKKPISRFRVLAETLAGNPIRVFDRVTKQQATVASPKQGYLDDPLFSPDGGTIVYAIGDAVNGAWGGNVGIGRVGADGKGDTALYAPQKSFGLFHLIGEKVFRNDRVFAMRRTPAAGGTFIADVYVVDVIDTGPPVTSVFSWGQRDQRRSVATGIAATASGELLLFDERWMTLDQARGVREPDEPVKTDAGRIAPDGKLSVHPSPKGLSIRDTATGAERRTVKVDGRVRSVTWAPDSKQLALIVTRYSNEEDEVFAHDELVVIPVRKD